MLAAEHAVHRRQPMETTMLLSDKVAVITGGAGINGLGYATARQMAAQGARVVILDLARADPAAAAADGWALATWAWWPTSPTRPPATPRRPRC
jgi:glycine/D-amino acid oxidase-like deaminating enzyme